MCRQCLVALLKSVVLFDVMKIIASDNNGSLHLHAFNNTSENTATDADVASEGTLLVNVGAFNGLEETIKGNMLLK